MSPNKRKLFASDTSDEDDSFKHQRSSLRVNLSYTENLTDSGNGSFMRTEIENNERTQAARTIKKLSRSKSSYEKNRRSYLDSKIESNINECADNNSEMSVQIKEGIQLKRLTINLEDISKEHHLETNCKRLKDAIICKTKEIFDKENELSIKITKVLGDNENYLANSTHNPNIENKTVLLDGTDHHSLKEKTAEKDEQHTDTLSDQRRKDQYSNIVATPTTSDRRKSLERTVDKSRLIQKRLFVGNRQVEEQIKCRVIEDVVLKKNQPLISLPRQLNQSGSPILSGSNRRLSLGRTRPKLHSQNQSLNNSYFIVHSTQTTSDIGIPVGCSTFIDDAMSEKEIDDLDISRGTCTMNKVVSMEMTEIYGGIRMSNKHTSLQNRNSDTIKCNENNTEKKSKEESMERNKKRLEDIEHSVNKVTVQNDIHSNLSFTDDANDQDMESIYVDTVIPMQVSIEQAAVVAKTRDVLQLHKHDSKAKYQNESRTISLSDSNDTIRSSLNVNTSLDGVTETNKIRNIRKPSDHGTNDANQDFEAISNKELSILNKRESVNTVRTSLQVNTSVDSIHKTWQGRSNKDDKDGNHSSMDMEYSSTTGNIETNDVDSLENMSLIDRLRNISVRNQISHNEIYHNDKSRVSKIRDEDKRQSSNSRDSYSYVEATPYPISRSILFRSQLKSKTQHFDDAATCSSNLNSMDIEEKNDKTKAIALHSKVSNETHESNNGTGTQKTITDTVTLENTSSCNLFVTQNQLVIEDRTNRTKSETDGKNIAVQNTERVSERKGRRKLLPLNESFELCSLTPVEDKKYTPEESSAKRNKRQKKKLPKRKLMHPKTKTNNIKCDTASKQMCSDSSDSDILENKKKENKRTRKPKKVISKKIVIKKFADENMLNILQENKQNKENHPIESRDSSDDFVECRTIATQWNKYKSQKIVIVTTGLSKGDKSLVKSIVKSLGKAEMEFNVSKRTTHVVSTGVRTVNLLRGIIRGCWLVPLEWVLKSLENNKWLDPEAFEMKHYSKAVQENRKDRQLFRLMYFPELFATCGFIHVEHQTKMPCDTLKELIKTAGGHITENIKLAKIIIGANGLKETWVIDSITTGELQLTKLYQRN